MAADRTGRQVSPSFYTTALFVFDDFGPFVEKSVAPVRELALRMRDLTQNYMSRIGGPVTTSYAPPQNWPEQPRRRQRPDKIAQDLPLQFWHVLATIRIGLGDAVTASTIALPPL